MSNNYKIVVKKGDALMYADGGELSYLPDSEQGIKDLITFLDKKRDDLMTKIELMQEPGEEESKNLFKVVEDGEPTKYVDVKNVFCETTVINPVDFENGLKKQTFFLGEGVEENDKIVRNTVKYVSATDIYYGEKVLIKKGEPVSYYTQVMAWSENEFKDNIHNIVIDLRPPGVYGSDFEQNLLNDGEGRYGEDFRILLKPIYQLPK